MKWRKPKVAERRAALQALTDLAGHVGTDTLIAALPLLTELVASGALPATPNTLRRFAFRLACLRRWAALREQYPNATNKQLDQRVADEAPGIDPDADVSTRSIRKWRTLWNGPGPGGLAGGPLALVDRYPTTPKSERASRPV